MFLVPNKHVLPHLVFLERVGETEHFADLVKLNLLMVSCDSCFLRAFTACVFKAITLVGSNQRNYFENATACSERTLKTTVATQIYGGSILRRFTPLQ